MFFVIVCAIFSSLFQTTLSSDEEEKKRILLNDPTLMDQRLAHLEQFTQEQAAENKRLKGLVQDLELKITTMQQGFKGEREGEHLIICIVHANPIYLHFL